MINHIDLFSVALKATFSEINSSTKPVYTIKF